ncbi:MAG: dihydroorotate dehydrogenase [Verrucomicrobia bacterium]|nr:MAG: dihydroorotate dehydrogenase [Verrucomicrobiota bacterium]
MTTPDISIKLAGIPMKNPVMVASGTFGYGPEYAPLVDLAKLGALVVKGISPEPWRGNPTPRTVEVASGLINAIGLQNPGAEGFLRDYLPFLRKFDVPVIVNIWGRTIEGYAAVAARLSQAEGIAALELNVSCPNIKEGSKSFGSNADMFKRVVAATRAVTKLPLIPKLAPDVFRIGEFARIAEAEGADALAITNSVPAMAIDIETRRPKLANVTGGLSGPAIRPIAVRLVWEAAKAVKIPIIGIGGIYSAADALEFFIAGASAVAVGTANFLEPTTALTVADGLRDYLARHKLGSIHELVGTLAC